jgi:hypothetical protein
MHNPATHPLDLVEQQFNQVAAFLASADAPQLQTAAAQLQALCVELPRVLQRQSPALLKQPALRQRVLALGRGLQILRDNLARQAAFNQQALQVVMVVPAKSTYSGSGSVYGAVVRQAGVHRYLAA